MSSLLLFIILFLFRWGKKIKEIKKVNFMQNNDSQGANQEQFLETLWTFKQRKKRTVFLLKILVKNCKTFCDRCNNCHTLAVLNVNYLFFVCPFALFDKNTMENIQPLKTSSVDAMIIDFITIRDFLKGIPSTTIVAYWLIFKFGMFDFIDI